MRGAAAATARPRLGIFSRFTKWSARWSAHAATFLGALLIILGWALAGPVFHFSDTWQLTINTATTVVTFLMVFIIQNTQTRDMEALQIKVDELIRATGSARNAILDLEELPEERLHEIQREYERLAERARALRRRRR